jgi:hypothetical protein
VEDGIMPPGQNTFMPAILDVKHVLILRGLSAGLEARLHGRQDACRYRQDFAVT